MLTYCNNYDTQVTPVCHGVSLVFLPVLRRRHPCVGLEETAEGSLSGKPRCRAIS